MLVTGTPAPPDGGHHHHHRHHHHSSSSSGGGGPAGTPGGMGFLRTPHHHKVPSPLSESISERFSMILDNCQKKIKLLQAPSNLFNNLVT
ncbi:hypothetical protein Hamer_G021852 [Homarus americanus]|uniref:Uncharacterized protein n=1 Tax=Homarus americanus TaxID=6706 RepID=A0A8J5MCL9_HOMAM|nr:hypothetical protein Hamer_G021852 [Homarus americanus]